MKNENEISKSSQDEWERIMTKWKMLQLIERSAQSAVGNEDVSKRK